MSTLDGKRFEDVYVTEIATGERKKALTKFRWTYGTSPDGTHLLYYDDGHFRTLDLATLKTFNISEKAPTSFVDAEDDHNVDRPPTRTIGWAADGKSVLISDGWDIWKLGVHGETAENLTVDGKANGIRYRGRVALDFEEKGIDLTKPLYFSMLEEWTKKSGYGRLEPAKPGINAVCLGGRRDRLTDQGEERGRVCLLTRDVQGVSELLPDRRDIQGCQEGHEHEPAAGRLRVDGRVEAGRLQLANGQKLQAALYLPAELRAGQEVPDDRVHLREAVARPAPVHSDRRPVGSISRSTRATATRC